LRMGWTEEKNHSKGGPLARKTENPWRIFSPALVSTRNDNQVRSISGFDAPTLHGRIEEAGRKVVGWQEKESAYRINGRDR